jgi:membrane-associated phospholipid phosphatase
MQVALCVLLAVTFALRHRRRLAVLALLGPGAGAALSERVLKPLVGRRNNGGALSFPSGHTTGAVAVAAVVVIFLLGPGRPPLALAWRALLAALVVVEAAAVATALVGAGYHYATDTVGGFGVATGTVLALALGIDAVADRRRPRLPALEPDVARPAARLG